MDILSAQQTNTTVVVRYGKNLVRRVLFYFSCLSGFFLMPKAHGQDISAPRFFDFSVQPTAAGSSAGSPDFGGGLAPQTQPNYNMSASLKFPIKLKGDTKVIGEVKHKSEALNGFYSMESDGFEQLKMRQSKGSIIVLSQLNEKWQLTNVLSASSRSADFVSSNMGYWEFRNISLVETQLKNGATIGFGGSVNYDQKLSFVPVFKYAMDFGKDWHLELLLPREVEVSKKLNHFSRLLFELKGTGTRYTLNGSQVANDLSATSLYKRTDVAGSIGYQRQVTPWVGFSVSAGAMMPVGAGIYANDRNQTQLLDLKEGISPYFKVGVFLSFPR